jgi:uncharacterized membrane protein YkvA (DUF1232 family)
VKISAVQLEFSAADIQAALVSYAGAWAEQPEVMLEPGALRLRLKVTHERVPLGLPVELRLTVASVAGSQVVLGVTWANFGMIPSFLKEIALQKAFEQLPGSYHDGRLTIDLAELLEEVPASFALEAISIGSDRVTVRVKDLVAAFLPVTTAGAPGQTIAAAAQPLPTHEGTAVVAAEARALQVVPERPIAAHGDFYREIRQKIQRFVTSRMPQWTEPLLPWVLAVPDFFVMLVRLARDPRVPTRSKILLGVTIAYFLSPLDVIPDLLGGLGLIDDMALALFAIEELQENVPAQVIEEAWPGDGKVLDLAAEGVQVVKRILPERTIKPLLGLLKKRQP